MSKMEYKQTEIRRELSHFANEISIDNCLNYTDINNRAEDFFCGLLNILWSVNLININKSNPYSAGYDLYDSNKHIYIQVSADGSKRKIEKSLKACVNLGLKGHFKFLCLKIKHKVSIDIINPNSQLQFTLENDFYDIGRISKEIEQASDEIFNKIYEYIKEERYPHDTGKLTSQLGIIIKALAATPKIDVSQTIIMFSPEIIEKISFNGLSELQTSLEEWASFGGLLENVYKEFPSSIIPIIQSKIAKSYHAVKDEGMHGLKLFYGIVDNLMNYVKENTKLDGITIEELDYDLSIIVTDTFLQCRIFEKPPIKKEDSNGTTR